jgi:hypothetical protein
MIFNEKLRNKLERQLAPVANKKLNISSEDPFSSIFINEIQYG